MKRITALTLAALMLFAALPQTAGAAFSDIYDAATKENVAVLEQLGVVDGMGGGNFQPGGTLTRAQFCKMAVCVMNKAGEAAQYANTAVFTDVRSSHWASGYIHYSVKNNMILGVGDGTFAPDKTITFAEAVTILMRMLGYVDSDFSVAWPNGYIAEAASTGLSDGVSAASGSTITRAQAAQLFVNLLCTQVKDEDELFAETVYSAVVRDVIVLSAEADGIDVYSSGAITGYDSSFEGTGGYIGRTCSLILGSNGKVLAILPADSEYTVKQITISSAEYSYIVDSAGARNYISATTPVYIGKELETYGDIWIDLKAGAGMILYYNAKNECKLIIANLGKTDVDADSVVLSGGVGSMSGLASMFGLSGSGYSLYKNGNLIDASDLAANDVITYNSFTKTFFASDFRLSGSYEAAYPNLTTPTQVVMYGETFDLLPAAREAITSFTRGKGIVLLFTDDMKVADVRSLTSISSSAVGYVGAISPGGTKIELLNGYSITVGVTNTGSTANLQDGLISFSSAGGGSAFLSAYAFKAPGAGLDLGEMKLGSASVSGSCRVFDSINAKCVKSVKLSDITLDTVPASQILHAEYDSAGKVNLLVLNDVTGLCYTYGKLKYALQKDERTDFGDIMNAMIGVQNSASEPDMCLYGSSSSLLNNKWGGAAIGGDGVGKGHVLLTSARVSRSDFSDGYVKIGGTNIKVSSDLLVYIEDAGKWGVELSEARAYSSELTVWYDRTPDTGGQVRVVVAG